ncbi:unnamed protein product [Effrenium voratum]|nr:unnamed protein product [Effrenium voratum]
MVVIDRAGRCCKCRACGRKGAAQARIWALRTLEQLQTPGRLARNAQAKFGKAKPKAKVPRQRNPRQPPAHRLPLPVWCEAGSLALLALPKLVGFLVLEPLEAPELRRLALLSRSSLRACAREMLAGNLGQVLGCRLVSLAEELPSTGSSRQQGLEAALRFLRGLRSKLACVAAGEEDLAKLDAFLLDFSSRMGRLRCMLEAA